MPSTTPSSHHYLKNISPEDRAKRKESAANVFVTGGHEDSIESAVDVNVTPSDVEHTSKDYSVHCIESPADVMPCYLQKQNLIDDPAMSKEFVSDAKPHVIQELAVGTDDIDNQESTTSILAYSLEELTIPEKKLPGYNSNCKASTGDVTSRNLGLPIEAVQEFKADIPLIDPKRIITKDNSGYFAEPNEEDKSRGLEMFCINFDYGGHILSNLDVATGDLIKFDDAATDQIPNETKTFGLENDIVELEDVDIKESRANVTVCDPIKFDDAITDCKRLNKRQTLRLHKKEIVKNTGQHEPTQPTLSKSTPTKIIPTQPTPYMSTPPHPGPSTSTTSKSSRDFDFGNSGQLHLIPSTSTRKDGLTNDISKPVFNFGNSGQFHFISSTSTRQDGLTNNLTKPDFDLANSGQLNLIPSTSTKQDGLTNISKPDFDFGNSGQFHFIPSTSNKQDGLTNLSKPDFDFGNSGQFHFMSSTSTKQDGLTKLSKPDFDFGNYRQLHFIPSTSTKQDGLTNLSKPDIDFGNSGQLHFIPSTSTKQDGLTNLSKPDFDFGNSGQYHFIPSTSTSQDGLTNLSKPDFDFGNSGQFHFIPSTSTKQDGLTNLSKPDFDFENSGQLHLHFIPSISIKQDGLSNISKPDLDFGNSGKFHFIPSTSTKQDGLTNLSKPDFLSIPSKSTPLITTRTQPTPFKSTPQDDLTSLSKPNFDFGNSPKFHFIPPTSTKQDGLTNLSKADFLSIPSKSTPLITTHTQPTPSKSTPQDGLTSLSKPDFDFGNSGKFHFIPPTSTNQDGLTNLSKPDFLSIPSKSTPLITTRTQPTPSKSTPQDGLTNLSKPDFLSIPSKSTPLLTTRTQPTPFKSTPQDDLTSLSKPDFDFGNSPKFHFIPPTSTNQDGLTNLSKPDFLSIPSKSTPLITTRTQPTPSKSTPQDGLSNLSKPDFLSIPSKSTPLITTRTQSTPSKSTPQDGFTNLSKPDFGFGNSGQFHYIPFTSTKQDSLTNLSKPDFDFGNSGQLHFIPPTNTKQDGLTNLSKPDFLSIPSKSTPLITTRTQPTPSKSTPQDGLTNLSKPDFDFGNSGKFHFIPPTSTKQDGLTNLSKPDFDFGNSGKFHFIPSTSTKQDGLTNLSKPDFLSIPSKSTPLITTRTQPTPFKSTPQDDSTSLSKPDFDFGNSPKFHFKPPTSTKQDGLTNLSKPDFLSIPSKSTPLITTRTQPTPSKSTPQDDLTSLSKPDFDFGNSPKFHFKPPTSTKQDGLTNLSKPDFLSIPSKSTPLITTRTQPTPSKSTPQDSLTSLSKPDFDFGNSGKFHFISPTSTNQDGLTNLSKPDFLSIPSKSTPLITTRTLPTPSKSTPPQLTPSKVTLFHPSPTKSTPSKRLNWDWAFSKKSDQSSFAQSISTPQDGSTKNRNSIDGVNNDDSDEDYNWHEQNRGKGNYHWQNSRDDRQKSRDGQNSCDGVMRKSYVKMPTGKRVFITIPVTSKCNCSKRNTETNLIVLRPDGGMGKTEHRIVENEMKNTIMRHKLAASGGGQFSNYQVVTIHKLVNCCLWKRFRNGQKQIAADVGFVNELMLFHGSTAVDHIVKTGFDERRANLNGMFGAGIYFAQHSSKSNQYVYGYLGGTGCQQHKDKNCYICERKMLLCRVTLGKSEQLTSANKLAHPPPGYHSVKGVPRKGAVGGLQYPEFVVYRGEQAYPEYLITYKIVK